MSRLDLLFVWHRTVALYVQSALSGDESWHLPQIDSEIGDPASCEIGRWLAAQGPEVAARPGFARLVECHHAYHQLAGGLLRERLAGRSRQLDADSREALQQASAGLAEAIGSLIAQLAPAGEQAAADAAAHAFWDDRLCTGVALIDQQHRAIAELAARISRAPETTFDSETGIDFLADFYRLVAFHFETEEQIMEREAHPPEWCRAHVAEHSALLDKIVSYSYEQTRGRGPERVADIMQDLHRIIVGHVIEYDFGFKPRVQAAP